MESEGHQASWKGKHCEKNNLWISFDPPDDWACWRPGSSGLAEDELVTLADGVGFRDSEV